MTDFADPDTYWSWHTDHGYTRVINALGHHDNPLGGSIVGARIREATV